MIVVNRTESLISGSYNGKQFSVSYDEQKYLQMLQLQEESESESVTTMEQMKEILEKFEPLTQESYKEVVQTATPYLVVNKHTNKFYLRYADKVSSKALPQVLVDKILKSVEKGIDFVPLIKCWVRFLRNPWYTDAKAKLFAEYISAPYTNDIMAAELMSKEGFSKEVAIARATNTQVSITQEGLLGCYKVSKEITKIYKKVPDGFGGDEVRLSDAYDFDVDPYTGMKTYKEPTAIEDRVFEPAIVGQNHDPFTCGGLSTNGVDPTLAHIIKVGCLISLKDWSQVDTSDHRIGAPGLHVGGLRYIHGYQKEGTVTHNVFVDPMDIGAICGLGTGNDGAMRVLRYFVHSSFAGVNKTIYHSSTYGAWTDAEYRKMLEEAVKKTEATKKELGSILEEGEALQVVSAKSKEGVEPLSTAKLFEK